MLPTLGQATPIYQWTAQTTQPAPAAGAPSGAPVTAPPTGPVDPREIRALEEELARHTRSINVAEATEKSLGASIGALDTRMADLQHRITDIVGDQKSHARWMNATNWVGKGGAAGVVVGLGLINSNALTAAGLMVGGLAVFAASYVLQIKARVRSGDLCGAANPLRREYDECSGTKQALSRQSVEVSHQAEEARTAMKKVQGRLDVLRMARDLEAAQNPRPAGRVEMQEETVRIGGVLVPRNAPAPA